MEFNWTTFDGLSIFGKEWKIADPKAVIALVHGFGEHSMRYDAMAKYYNERGYAMVGYDRRGHGQSSGPRGHTPDYEALLKEIDILIDTSKERYPGKPIVLYGHSMGGNLVLNYMIERQNPDIDVQLVTGPWIKLVAEPPALLKLIVRMMRHVAPGFTQGKKLADFISRVKDEREKYMNDPLNHGKISFNLAHAMFTSSDFLYKYKGEFQIPTLIQHAGDDKLTSPDASKIFVDNISGDVTFRIWEGLYHEIHNESNREQVYDYSIEWMDTKLQELIK